MFFFSVGEKSLIIPGDFYHGMEILRSITRPYYADAVVALLVYDITRCYLCLIHILLYCSHTHILIVDIRREKFKKLGRWLEDVRQHGNTEMTIMLVGNKCGLVYTRALSTQEGVQFAKMNGLLSMEVSSKTAHNVEQTFIQSASSVYDKIQGGVFYDVYCDGNERFGIKVGGAGLPRPLARQEDAASDGLNCGVTGFEISR